MAKTKQSSIDFDGLRVKYPDFSFAAYAFEPDAVTLEAVAAESDEITRIRSGSLREAADHMDTLLKPGIRQAVDDLSAALQARIAEAPKAPEPDIFG